jgi:hypothetical protein
VWRHTLVFGAISAEKRKPACQGSGRPDRIYKIKHDGYRLIVERDGKRACELAEFYAGSLALDRSPFVDFAQHCGCLRPAQARCERPAAYHAASAVWSALGHFATVMNCRWHFRLASDSDRAFPNLPPVVEKSTCSSGECSLNVSLTQYRTICCAVSPAAGCVIIRRLHDDPPLLRDRKEMAMAIKPGAATVSWAQEPSLRKDVEGRGLSGGFFRCRNVIREDPR